MRTVTFPAVDGIDPKSILVEIARQPIGGMVRGAMDLDQVRRGLRVLDGIEAAKESFDLEDADWKHLCEKVRAFPFVQVDRRIIAICDAVLDAQPGD